MFKGINQDIHPKYSKETYNYALNSNVENETTEYPFINSDFGNTECFKVEGRIIGHCLDKDNNFILITNANKIYRAADCDVVDITQNIDYSCLNLEASEYVEIVYNILRGCEEVIYIADGRNRYKSINLTKLPATCADMHYSPDLIDPIITYKLESGGSVRAGNYFYTIRYLDDNGTPTNWLLFKDPISVYDPNRNKLKTDVSGIDTGKSIHFLIDNLDPKFKSFQIGIIEYSAKSRTITKVFMLPANSTYYTGTNEIEVTSPNDLTVNKLTLDLVGTHVKHLNRLFVGNISYKQYNWATVQKLVNNIPVKYTVSELPKTEPTAIRTFRHNDVYDFAVYGRFANGRTTPAFHIPGRTKDIQLTEFNTTTINHPTQGIKEKLDSELIPNDLNLTYGSSCKAETLDYQVIYSTGFNSITVTVTLQFPNPLAILDFAIEYGSTANIRQRNNISTGTSVTETFTYDGTIKNTRMAIVAKVGDCEWRVSVPDILYKPVSFGSAVMLPYKANSTLVERWRAVNTALKDSTPMIGYYSSGVPGYWESSELYPKSLDCEGVPIYPHTVTIVNGKPEYTMLPVRYHRMPDQLLEEALSKDKVRPLNYYIDLRTFIEELTKLDDNFLDVVSWEVGYGQRDNPLVVDTGIAWPNKLFVQSGGENPNASTFTQTLGGLASFPNMATATGLLGSVLSHSKNEYTYISPNTLFKERVEGTVFNVVKTYLDNSWTSLRTRKYNHTVTPPTTIINMFDTWWFYDFFMSNIYINGMLYSGSIATTLISPVKHITDGDGGEYLGIASNINGTPVRNMLYSNNVGIIKSIKKDLFNSSHSYMLDLLNYGEPYTFQKTLYHTNKEGDAWLTPFTFTIKQPGFIYDTNRGPGILSDVTNWLNDGLGGDISRATYGKALCDLWIESDINCRNRFIGSETWETFYNYSGGSDRFLDLDRKQIGGGTEEDAIWEYFPDYNMWSADYSEVYSPSVFQKLSPFYDYCSDCGDSNPNRIYYSEETYIENSKDNFKSILVNNYQDLENPVNAVFLNKDELYARTLKHIYRLYTRESKIEATNANIFIGNNELLTIPAMRTSTTDYIFGGATHKGDIINTEHGVFYISDNKIIHMADAPNKLVDASPKDLSSGLRAFLRENLRTPGTNLNKYSLSYDFRYNRVFITKRDYRPLHPNIVKEDQKWFFVTGPTLDYTNDLNLLGVYKEYIPEQEYNKAMFEDKSFTLSYNLLTDAFVSFHSWIPEYMFFSNKGYYSQKGDTVYIHNTDNYLNYYGKDYSHILDLPINNNTIGAEHTPTLVWTNAMYTQNSNHSTWDGYIAYNEDQSTGYVPLTIKTSVFSPHNLTRIEKIYKMDLGKNVVNRPLFYTDWTNIRDSYPIDKVTLPNIITGAFKEHLRGQYINIRYFYSNINKPNKDRVSFDYISTIQLNSMR